MIAQRLNINEIKYLSGDKGNFNVARSRKVIEAMDQRVNDANLNAFCRDVRFGPILTDLDQIDIYKTTEHLNKLPSLELYLNERANVMKMKDFRSGRVFDNQIELKHVNRVKINFPDTEPYYDGILNGKKVRDTTEEYYRKYQDRKECKIVVNGVDTYKNVSGFHQIPLNEKVYYPNYMVGSQSLQTNIFFINAPTRQLVYSVEDERGDMPFIVKMLNTNVSEELTVFYQYKPYIRLPRAMLEPYLELNGDMLLDFGRQMVCDGDLNEQGNKIMYSREYRSSENYSMHIDMILGRIFYFVNEHYRPEELIEPLPTERANITGLEKSLKIYKLAMQGIKSTYFESDRVVNAINAKIMYYRSMPIPLSHFFNGEVNGVRMRDTLNLLGEMVMLGNLYRQRFDFRDAYKERLYYQDIIQ